MDMKLMLSIRSNKFYISDLEKDVEISQDDFFKYRKEFGLSFVQLPSLIDVMHVAEIENEEIINLLKK